MRTRPKDAIERGRVQTATWGTPAFSPHGKFHVRRGGVVLQIISSGTGEGSMGWEHVSVSLPDRCPTWEEMDWVRRQFWEDDEVVMQLHVAVSDHVNVHNHCLHLWRPLEAEIPLPPRVLV